MSIPIYESSSHTALEETTAAIAGVYTVMFTTAGVPTHFTEQSRAESFAWGRTLGWNLKESISIVLVLLFFAGWVSTDLGMSSPSAYVLGVNIYVYIFIHIYIYIYIC